MLLTQVLPVGPSVDIADADGRAWLESVYAPDPGPFVRLNMITSLTGSAAGPDGTSASLSNRIDRAVLGVIRQHADVAIVGAQSVRAEGYIVPRSARLAVVTRSGDLSGHRLDAPTEGAPPVLVLCPESRQAAVRARLADLHMEVIGVPADAAGLLGPPRILDVLRARGLESAVCEGGPTLAGRFIAAGVVDEVCVTVAPALTPSSGPFIPVGADDDPPGAVAGMLVDQSGFSYLRLRRRP
jgi:riboflavin biosynthesis pyrimidine reductase